MMLSSIVTENLQNLLSGMIATLPRLFGGIVFIVIGFIVAKYLSKLVAKVSRRLGVDKLGAQLNKIEMIENANFSIHLSKILAKIVYYFTALIFLVAATDVIGMPALSDLFNDILNWIPNLLVALVILAVGIVFADFLKGIIHTACTSFGIPSAKLISMFAFYFLLINIVISALAQAQVDTSFISSNLSILIGGAALAFAIAYGLASKSVLANFLTSHYSADKLHIGDRIRIEGHEGEITDMDRSSLTLSTKDKKVLIPLHKVSSETIELLEKTTSNE